MLYALTVLIWGSTWFAVELQLGAVAPEVSLVYRYGAASLLLFAWSRFRRLQLRFSLREHAWFFLLGVLLFGLNYIIVYRAQIHITSALTAIAFSSIPCMVWTWRSYLASPMLCSVVIYSLLLTPSLPQTQ